MYRESHELNKVSFVYNTKEITVKWIKILLIKGEGNGHKMNRDPSDKRRRKCTYSKKVLYILSEGFIHILRRFCTNFKMRRKYTYSKKVLYIFSISQKDLRRCEGSLKDLYTPWTVSSVKFGHNFWKWGTTSLIIFSAWSAISTQHSSAACSSNWSFLACIAKGQQLVLDGLTWPPRLLPCTKRPKVSGPPYAQSPLFSCTNQVLVTIALKLMSVSR